MGIMINKKIYILHGWTYDLDKWKVFGNLLLKNGFTPVFLKVPGLTQKTNKIWDIEKYSNWLGEELKKENGQIILLGHSNGGRIASYFASMHPEKIAKLILKDK